MLRCISQMILAYQTQSILFTVTPLTVIFKIKTKYGEQSKFPNPVVRHRVRECFKWGVTLLYYQIMIKASWCLPQEHLHFCPKIRYFMYSLVLKQCIQNYAFFFFTQITSSLIHSYVCIIYYVPLIVFLNDYWFTLLI